MQNKVLIVDDSIYIRQSLKNMLSKYGYVVCGEASNGNEALTQYKALTPDLVTLDITMAEKDGLTAAKEILLHDPNAKIIMCTAMGQQQMVLEALKSGVKDFIVKPLKEDRVLHAVKRVLPLQ